MIGNLIEEGAELLSEGSRAQELPHHGSKGAYGMVGPKFRKLVKRDTNRKWRRMMRKDPEMSPQHRPIKGYAD